MIETLIVFLPLIGAISAGFFGKSLGDKGAQFVTCALLVLSAVLSMFLFYDVVSHGSSWVTPLFTWIDSGALEVSWALKIDTLTAVMLFVVTSVSALVHIYSVGYMSHDPHKPRFMAYLSLFTFAMLMLVTSDNLVQMFFGWEGVGLCSYLLINFWYKKPSANHASIKAFLVNRVGDFGFVLGIASIFLLFGSVEFDVILNPDQIAEKSWEGFELWGHQFPVLTATCLLLFMGAMGKSAQLGLHTWLPDAMEGPTPVSALIHAATMVTAGVFMVARLSPVFEAAPFALDVVAVVGATTAIVAATIGMTQFDIKRVVAYSTMSQLGYMFFALGVSAYGAAVFHLMTHAFFKALLFLGSGSVIHAMSDEQDMRKMGGIWKRIPRTYTLMWIGTLALAGVGVPGVFGLAGFYSKDMILEAAWAQHDMVGNYAYWVGIVTVFLTALYSTRLMFMTFHGQPRGDEAVMARIHESPMVMIFPLILLAIGAIFAGIVGYDAFVGESHFRFWGEAIWMDIAEGADGHHHHPPLWVLWLPIVMALSGIGMSYLLYVSHPDWPRKLTLRISALHKLCFNKYYFDVLYDKVLVRAAMTLGLALWRSGDQRTIDRFGPNGISALVRKGAGMIARMQTGYLYHYAFVMVIGVVVLIGWFAWGSWGEMPGTISLSGGVE